MGAKGDTAMTQAETMSPEPAAFVYDLFVIHAADDVDFVRGYLLPALNLPPARVLLIDELPLGRELVSQIDRCVSGSRFTVAVLSPAYLQDRWAVFGEQLASHISVRDVRVLPLRLLDCELPLRLDARVSLDFTDRTRWETESARLRDLLQTPAPADEQIACPYPGMRPFGTKDASRFFGRDQEIDDLIGRLDRGEREIYVIGPSGSGKSSLVQAGLVPVLEAGSSRLERSFVVRTMRPGELPADRLAKIFEGDLATLSATPAGTPAATPAVTIEAFVARHPPAQRVLVFVDQLEELFTVASAAERQRFIAALRVIRAEPRCSLVLGLRADFYGALLDSELGPDLARRIVPLVVAPLRGAALAEAIRAPAMRVGVHLEVRLCDRLVADAADEPGALPLVQETLRLLWDKRRQRLLGLAQYEELGDGRRGLDVAIAKRADTAMSGLTAAQQMIARRVLLRLVSFGEGRPDTRRQQEVQALRSAADDGAELSKVLQQLVENRLVTVDGAEADHDALADLSHEALIRGWPALRVWIDGRRADEQRRRRLDAKVAEWVERGEGDASLLDPVELSEAVQWTQSDAARELGYAAKLPALVAASRSDLDKLQRQRRQRTVRAFAVLAGFAVVASILGLVAWHQRREAQENGLVAQQKGVEAEQQTKKVRRLLAMSYLEQGRGLLLDGHPMRALPYFVAARTESIESPVLRMLFAQAARDVPLVTFLGHTSNVVAAGFSADGTRVVTASADNTARVWDATTGKPVAGPLEHQGGVTAAAFSADGARVVTASVDKMVRVWDATTGKRLTGPLKHERTVRAAAFSADGTRLVTASWHGTARVWDATTGKLLTGPLGRGDDATAVAFSRDGTRLVAAKPDGTTGGWDATAWVWDATTGTPVTRLLEHRGPVFAAAFSADGTRVVTASLDNTVRVWDATTGTPATGPLEHQGPVSAVAFSADGMLVVTASWDKTARVWNAWTGNPVTGPLEHHAEVMAAAFSPDDTRVVTASKDNTARVWNAWTGKPVTGPFEHQGPVTAVAFSPDGTRVVTASADKTVRVWDASTDRPVNAPLTYEALYQQGFQQGIYPQGHPRYGLYQEGLFLERFAAAAFSADGTRLVGVSEDTAQVWNSLTGKPVTGPLEHQGRVTAAAFSADGTRVITASADRTARVWDAATGGPLTGPLEHQAGVTAAAFSLDGTRVVTASADKTARVWDATTGKPLTGPLEHQGEVTAAAFSADGTRVVTASADKTARVWDASTGKPVIGPLEHQGEVSAAAFNADGTRVVTASADKTARVWDARTGKAVTGPLEHQDKVTAAAFNADGTRVVTASADKAARVWDATTGEAVTGPLEHQDKVTAAAFSVDNTRVVTASQDTTARVWDATTGKPVTAPLKHLGAVTAAVFTTDGTRVVTASADHRARVWTLAIDTGSLDDWRRLVRCSPFAFNNTALTANPSPPSVCAMIASRTPLP